MMSAVERRSVPGESTIRDLLRRARDRYWLSRTAVRGESRIRRVRIGGIDLEMGDSGRSTAVDRVARELRRGEYLLDEIPFQEGDTVVDVGGHVGLVAIYLGLRHPGIRVLSFEPFEENYQRFQENLKRNRVDNVEVFHQAVTGDGRDLNLVVNFHENTGGATAWLGNMEGKGYRRWTVGSTTLERIFTDHQIDRCRLLKIDCEGGEYEILEGFGRLDAVDYLRGEFHTNARLSGLGYDIDRLIAHCETEIASDRIAVTRCRMSD